jgi:tRNA uridine 5-carboxymethylaminomethyl modification enzyme
LGVFVLENKQIIIVGGGHAGLEAAFAISRAGGSCSIVTMDPKALGRLSCNPAIGGLGKSHLVKEIDALGGIMGFCADMAGIQFKTLNKTKGRAVWANRVQVDKKKYPKTIDRLIKKNKKINIIKGEVVDFSIKKNKIYSATLKTGEALRCQALVITCGTFLNGLIHIGKRSFPAGRMGEMPASGLTESLKNKGFIIGRLKTGTPPRLLASSIRWSKTKESSGDSNPSPFSLYTKTIQKNKQQSCFIINTNQDVHTVINKNIKKSAMFSGKISGVGPRYCPSIEDKVFRFSHNPSHMLFLEPEWDKSEQIYLNGFSTSLPEEVQLEALRKIPGLEGVELIRPGYAIEYDYSPPYQLTNTLMSKKLGGVFFAGQINGTSGYEEAAAQGLVAGANAYKYITKQDPFVLTRNSSYIGVMVDDLITTHLDEPYRMFTSRAEHRLFLRADNCYSRLFKIAKRNGLLMKEQLTKIQALLSTEAELLSWVQKKSIQEKKKTVPCQKFLKRPEVSLVDLVPLNIKKLPFFQQACFNVETNIKYEGYILNEQQRILSAKNLENLKVPKLFKYNNLQGLSNESKARLNKVQPQTLGQASRISGIRPTDITLLGIYLKKGVSRET